MLYQRNSMWYTTVENIWKYVTFYKFWLKVIFLFETENWFYVPLLVKTI